MSAAGIYIHVPFCMRKCPYCDFYSVMACEKDYDSYSDRVCEQITTYTGNVKNAETIYFGGGTPSIIGAKRLVRIADAVCNRFCLEEGAEVTAEVNPAKEDMDFSLLRKGGFNRISIGLQSANDNELSALGRPHDAFQAKNCIEKAKREGFENISLDLMLCIPHQTKESLLRSIEFCAESGATHISAYLLKIEEGTRFFEIRNDIELPDDVQAEYYMYACEKLEEYGYRQYEISNFSRPGFESRHNLIYWRDEEYIGFGPSAHSFAEGKRYHYGSSLDGRVWDEIQDDGNGGYPEEYIMLGLRLSEGISRVKFRERFSMDIPVKYLKNVGLLVGTGLVRLSNDGFSLTREGFLLSNTVIGKILS